MPTSTSRPPEDIEQLLEAFGNGATPALARVLSMVENHRPGFERLLATLHPRVGDGHRIGITGPPGAGKSTLIEALVGEYRARDLRVGVIAVDPTSGVTGGALLGDRVRMERVALDPGVFIRSTAARGAVGGVATTTRELCDVLDAFGFDRIIVETVGVGQSEMSIAAAADSAVLVLVPESGDGVQVLKAGIMEVADLYVVNKADRAGAAGLAADVTAMLAMRRDLAGAGAPPWDPTVLLTTATTGDGVPEVVAALDAHADRLGQSGDLTRRRRLGLERHVRAVVERALRDRLWSGESAARALDRGMDHIARGESTPYDVAAQILRARFGQPEG